MSDPANITPDRLVAAYMKMREKKASLTRQFEEEVKGIETSMKLIEAHLLDFLNKTGQKNGSTVDGTFYKELVIKPSAADWNVVYNWIKENDAFDMLEKRLTKKFVVDYLAEHDDTPPPGVNVHREFTVRIRSK